MNVLLGMDFPDSSWGKVETPLGVISPGDLTFGSEQAQWDLYIGDYGLTGSEGLLNYPIYEGIGNRDSTIVTNGITLRNQSRPGINISNNGLHYSWDWDDVHFINLNLSYDTYESFTFLTNDLQQNLIFQKQPVIIYHYYRANDTTYYNAISNYNVTAIIHGHEHKASNTLWNGIHVFTAPASYLSKYYAIHISNNIIRVAERTSSGTWDNYWEKTFSNFIPSKPVMLPATAVAENEFTANWNSVSNSSSYIFDVSTNDSFGDFTSGYQNLGVGGTNETVTELITETIYYYRIKATNSFGLDFIPMCLM